ncbi:MAG: DMT family transporter [Candidatus Bathyarchaeota archaeon]|jgi:drug/metabolite transporter (DMT)-like permease|nr:EamA family transporter [Candidatus Bathyarchaeota archaeon A05DMB-5]MDH7557635.1 DMT family transporter [Candidatus Bathyarchaeota archaeon]
MQQTKGYLLIVAASVIWGTMGIFGKLAFAYGIDPITLTALRIVISSSTMLLALLLFRRSLLKIEKKDLPQLIIFGVLAVALQRVAYFYTVDLTTATIAAVMFYTYPVFVTVHASIFLKEKITSTVILAIVLAFSGVALVVKAYEVAWLNTNLLGLAFGILTSLLFALYFLMCRTLRTRYTNWTLLLYGDGIGAIALIPTLFLSSSQIVNYPPQLWTLIIIIGLFPSLTAYLLFSYALKYVESAKGSILSVIEPLSAAAFSITILGEKFEIWQAAGVALALTGIILLFYKPKPKN